MDVSGETIDRTQTGVRIATPMLKVLRALADYNDMSLSDLLEGIVLHAFDNQPPFSEESLQVIAKLRDIYGLKLTSADAHTFGDHEGGGDA